MIGLILVSIGLIFQYLLARLPIYNKHACTTIQVTSEANKSKPLWSNFQIVIFNLSHVIAGFFHFQVEFILRGTISISKKLWINQRSLRTILYIQYNPVSYVQNLTHLPDFYIKLRLINCSRVTVIVFWFNGNGVIKTSF